VGDIQIADFAPYLMKAFGGEKDEQAGIGALIGVDFSSLQGMGVGKGASFDVTMEAEDGRLNVNCGGGFNDMQRQQGTYALLSALFWPPRYNRIFESADSNGQYASRDDVARAIMDWADNDTARYDPIPGQSSGAEDYRYDGTKDPYQAHNHLFDSVEELNLVRGVNDELWGSFGEMLTTYGTCKLNIGAIKPEHWPLMAALLRATVKDDQKMNPVLLDDALLAGLSQQILGMSKMTGGFQSVQQFVQLVSNPASALSGTTGTGSSSSSSSSGQITGIPLDQAKVNNVAKVGPRLVWRLDSVGSISRGGPEGKKIQVHIRAVWDTQHFNQNTTSGDPNDRQGTWIYWRQD
jgi:hypothetical protein